MKFFVTGSLGFIGSALIKQLLKDNNDVIGFDLAISNSTLNYKCIKGDIRNFNFLYESIPNDIDVIIHLAAEHKDEGLSKEDYFSVNVDGTKNLLEVAEKKKINRLIFFSSSAIYGNNPFPNEVVKPSPLNDYGKSKYKAEMIIEKWVEKEKNKAIILRPSAVYGPNNKANIYKFINSVYKNKFLLIGKGENIKSFIYIKNLVSATLFTIQNFDKNLIRYNLVDEPYLTIREFVDLIRKVCGRKNMGKNIYLPLFLGVPIVFFIEKLYFFLKITPFINNNKLTKFVSNSKIDGSHIKNKGFIQSISNQEGITDTINWIKQDPS